MKKIISLIIATMILFSLCACAITVETPENSTQATADATTESSAATTNESTEVITEATTESITAAALYVVTFVDYDNSFLSSAIVYEGNAATPPETPQRAGYTFSGWDKDFTNVKSNLTIKAQYDLIIDESTEITTEATTEATIETAHNFSAWIVTKNPTCTETGEQTRVCSLCGEKQTQTIAATGHMHVITVTENEKPATCTESGKYDIVTYCSDCHMELARQYLTVAATGHIAGDLIIEKVPTCTESGKGYRVCAVCSTTLKIETIPATGHTYGSWVIDKVATCTENGARHCDCITCGTRKNETIYSTGHAWKDATYIEPKTCTICGKTEGTPTTDFGGHTFRFITTEDWSDGTGGFNTLKEIYVDSRNSGTIIDTAVYDRNLLMHQLYNCSISAVGSEDCSTLIQNDVNSGTNEYDFGSKQYLWYASNPNGYYMNVYSLDLDFDLPGWNRSYFDYTTVRDSNGIKHNYMIDGEFNLMTYRTTWAIFVNLDMYNANKSKWGGDDIFTLVQEGRWTIDKMEEIITAVAQDDGDHIWTATKEDQKDIFGLMTTAHNAYGLMTSVGFRTFENNDGYLSTSVEILTGNDATNALKKAGELSTMEGVYVGSYAVNREAWNGGKALFMGEVLNHLETIKDIENMFSYTVIPEPIYTESDHPVYHSYVNNKGSLYLISKNACGGDKEMVSNFLNLFVYHSHHIVYPAFLEAYGKIYCDDERSAEMLDTIVNGIVYDIGYYKNNPAWSNVAEMVNTNNVKLSRAANQLVGNMTTEIENLVKNMDKSE